MPKEGAVQGPYSSLCLGDRKRQAGHCSRSRVSDGREAGSEVREVQD